MNGKPPSTPWEMFLDTSSQSEPYNSKPVGVSPLPARLKLSRSRAGERLSLSSEVPAVIDSISFASSIWSLSEAVALALFLNRPMSNAVITPSLGAWSSDLPGLRAAIIEMSCLYGANIFQSMLLFRSHLSCFNVVSISRANSSLRASSSEFATPFCPTHFLIRISLILPKSEAFSVTKFPIRRSCSASSPSRTVTRAVSVWVLIASPFKDP